MALFALWTLGVITNTYAAKVYSFEKAIEALEKGLDIQTIYSSTDKLGITETCALRINYYFQDPNDTITYYDTQLMIDLDRISRDKSSPVVYHVRNAAIYGNSNNESLSTRLHLYSSYLNAQNLSVQGHSMTNNYTLSNTTAAEMRAFYFTFTDENTSADHRYTMHNFEELVIAMENGGNIRTRINLSSNETNIICSGKVIQNNGDIFDVFMKGIHSDRIGNQWKSIKDVSVSWTTQQLIHDPFKSIQYHIVSTNVVSVKGVMNMHSAILDTSMEILGWINASAPLKRNVVSFYSDIKLD
eukprot:1143937_1